MRPLSIFFSVAVAMLLGLFAAGRGARTIAQEATPAAPNLVVGQISPIGQQFEILPGIDVEFLNEGQPAATPGQSLVVYRITFRPGPGVPAHTHPGTTIATVESGALSWTLLKGTVWVTRPGQEPEEVTAPGTELVLEPGEGLIYNDDIVHTARAAGDQPAVAMVAVLFQVGQPLLTFTNDQGMPMAMGTPAP